MVSQIISNAPTNNKLVYTNSITNHMLRHDGEKAEQGVVGTAAFMEYYSHNY